MNMTKAVIPAKGALSAPLQGSPAPPHRILVVDDEPSIRKLLTAVLGHSGYEVESAEDGAVAWEALQAKPYDLLITDQNMPKVSGIELIKNVRSASMALPVVMVAGIVPVDELAQNPSLHLSATLSKPFALSDLLDTVTNALQMAE
jgi:DNA-binding NtrC family response regulator